MSHPLNDAEALKMEFPEVELAMECDSIREQLVGRLKLQAVVAQDELTSFARVQLNDGYSLMIRPDVTGINGTNFWLKWNLFTNNQTGEERMFSQIRCEIELQHQAAPNQEASKVISFGIDARNVERMLEKATQQIAALKGLRLIPLPIVEIN
jgi:hypothetical protein